MEIGMKKSVIRLKQNILWTRIKGDRKKGNM